jgi:hypothetical protein
MRLLAGRGYWVVVGAIAVTACLAIWFAAERVIPEILQGGYLPARPSAGDLAGASTSTTPSPGLVMNGAQLPDGAECSGCHLADRGVIGLRPIPAMGHPLEGWTDCTACHAPDRLVATAPGHSGIHATECLTCHLPGSQPAPLSRPHRDRQNMACLDCHGSVAPLPADMTHRSESVCWLCHRLPDVPPPVPAHLTAAGETDCLTCHVAQGVGALPPDHSGRTGDECLLCHDVPLGSQASGWVPRVGWPEG